MRQVLCILALLVFLVGGWIESACAAVPDLAGIHQVDDVATDDVQDCRDAGSKHQNQKQADHGSCQDCCCYHTHAMTKTALGGTSVGPLEKESVDGVHASLRSVDFSSLYRPPII